MIKATIINGNIPEMQVFAVNCLKLKRTCYTMCRQTFKKRGYSIQIRQSSYFCYQLSVLNDEAGKPCVLKILPSAQFLNA